MNIKESYVRRGKWKLLLLSMLVVIVILLTVCVVYFPNHIVGLLGPCAPQRSFKLEDLLIDQSVIPAVWPDVWGPDTEFYDSGCGSAYASIRFGVAERELPLQASHEIEHRGKIVWARAAFENSRMFLSYPRQPVEWTYQSTVADQSYFGCADDRTSNSLLSCQWVGLYEEFIVVFWVRMTPGEVNFEDIEKAVEAIDARMALYLNEDSTSTLSIE